MVCHSLLQWITFCQTSPPWPTHLGWLGFIELDKAVVLVWLDWLVFCEHGFSVSALWCPLATPTILLGFLLPWTWGISSQQLQQSAATAPYLRPGLSPHCRPPDLEHGIAPLGPLLRSHRSLDVGLLLSATTAGLGRGVTPLGSRPSGMGKIPFRLQQKHDP